MRESIKTVSLSSLNLKDYFLNGDSNTLAIADELK